MRLPMLTRRFRSLITGLSLGAILAVGSPLLAEQETGKPTKLVLEPAEIKLVGTRALQYLQVTGNYTSEDVRDLTGAAELKSSAPNIVKIEKGVAYPVSNGTAEITATAGGLESKVKVTVTGMETPTLVSFKNDTIAALSKSGCNMGACHGSPSGKAGFRLSLRGYDPALDIVTLRTEFYGRRTNSMDPANSLILTKPAMLVAHGGGRRLRIGDPSYSTLHDWIGEGMKLDADAIPDLVKVEVYPKKRVFQATGERQQLRVDAHFSDGSVRDVTALTVYSSSNESVATIGKTGLVEKEARGETAVLVRYLDKMSTSYITFLDDVKGFVWSNPPENTFVDTLINDKLKQLQILPSELCSEEEFLRRAYLDTAGRLPTIKETVAYLSDSSENRRSVLVDQLLDSDDFASYWTLKWGDILRSNSKKLKTKGVHKFRRWIYDSVRTDKPLDQFARELLTAQGSVYENPPANYWRASRDPLDATETTAQLFLGIRIQCAKCHNHPFEKWTQDNYYGIGAVFARVGRKAGFEADDEIIFVSDSGEVKQPRTGKTMKPHLLLKGDVDVPADHDRRVVFAKWLTEADNPFFAKVSVNRIWGHLMGRGIVEPVDDFRDSNPPSNAPLLDKLAEGFVKNNFSRKWTIRAIMNSRTYQLSSRKNDFNANDELYFSHAGTRMLSAEQLLDAICQVTSVPENFKGLPVGFRAVELPDPPTDHYFLKIFGQPQREMACACERSNESNLSQALQMINGPVVHNKLRADNGRIAILITAKKANEEIVTELYLSALSRKPAATEMAAALKHVGDHKDKERRQALEDVGWALLNSKEFLFQH